MAPQELKGGLRPVIGTAWHLVETLQIYQVSPACCLRHFFMITSNQGTMKKKMLMEDQRSKATLKGAVFLTKPIPPEVDFQKIFFQVGARKCMPYATRHKPPHKQQLTWHSLWDLHVGLP